MAFIAPKPEGLVPIIGGHEHEVHMYKVVSSMACV